LCVYRWRQNKRNVNIYVPAEAVSLNVFMVLLFRIFKIPAVRRRLNSQCPLDANNGSFLSICLALYLESTGSNSVFRVASFHLNTLLQFALRVFMLGHGVCVTWQYKGQNKSKQIGQIMAHHKLCNILVMELTSDTISMNFIMSIDVALQTFWTLPVFLPILKIWWRSV